jgi:hypothetical protein
MDERFQKDECREDARVGYQVAVDLAIKEEKLFWDEFNALLVANSILIIAISSLICRSSSCAGECVHKNLVSNLPWFLAVIGLFLCVLWYLSTVRRDAYRKYYLFSARELEEGLEKVSTIQRGRDFSKGNPIWFRSKVKEDECERIFFQLPFPGKIKVPLWTKTVIILFASIYVFVFLLSVQCPAMHCLIIVTIIIILCFLMKNHLSKEEYEIKITLDKECSKKLSSIKENMNLGDYSKTIQHLIDNFDNYRKNDA